MSTTLPSDEVAEDYKGALEDLVSNDRYQIANLTMIAKENIEHAEAISRVLTNHINRAPPTRKLPALYVLDSLVKNIGSPYTVYFGRNLHQTYMLAYSQVDSMVRRKLEEMLKTWREPVPGSLSTTPVFPISSTQTIVDSLNRFRASTAAVPHRQQSTPVQGVRQAHLSDPYRSTPTPPIPYGQNSSHTSHQMSTPQPHVNQYGASQLPGISSYQQPPTPQYQQPPTPQPQPQSQLVQSHTAQSSVNLTQLHADIDDLTTDAKIECATHPMNQAAQKKLSTLQTLKEILESGSASEQDLLDIRSTIAQELSKKGGIQSHQPQPPTPQMPPQNPYLSQPQYTVQSQYQPPPPVPTPSFLNSTNLAELLRVATSHQQPQQQPQQQPSFPPFPPQMHSYSTPPVTHAMPVVVPPPPIPPTMPQLPTGTLPLLEQLRASGLFSSTPPPPPGMPTPMSNLASFLSGSISTEVQFMSASIKVSRPQLVTSFLTARENQCSTCGRRFTSDDVGKEKKTRHLDWHFRTKARMIEVEKRGQNRSWYVDEREWMSSQEFEDDMTTEDNNLDSRANGSSPNNPNNKQNKQQDFVRAPADPVLRNMPCPIDQESFRSEWSEEVQDFIWKDAIKVGNRYYHASCYREATKDRDKENANIAANAASVVTRTATPDSVLGKRKAEQEAESASKSKVKLEA